MLHLTREQIKEIAEELDCGLRCFLHKTTGAFKSIPKDEDMEYAELESWEEDIQELEENWTDYLEFERMPSREAFQVMEDFAESIDNGTLKERLFRSLNRPKPFRIFKDEIENSGLYREQWFVFRDERNRMWVEKQLDEFNSVEGDE
jgi:hypothetical protein